MSRPFVWLPVCLLGGCAQLAGIDNTSGDGRQGLSLVVERASVGTTIERTPQDLTGHTATYLIADPAGTREVPAVETEPGTWSADVFDATPPVVFDLPDDPPFDRQLELPSKNLIVGFDVLEHPDPVVSAPTDTITVSTTLDRVVAANDTFQLFVVGTWTLRGLEATAGAATLAPAAFEVQAMASLTGRPQEQISLADTPLVLRYVGTRLDGLFEPAPFSQVAANTVSGAMTAVLADQTLSATIDQPAATAKLGVVRPAITLGPTFSFDVSAAPGATLGVTTGPRLVSGAPLAMDTTLTAAYANPFASKGWTTVLSYSIGGSRTLTPTGETLPVTLSAGMAQLVADPPAGLALDFPVAVPELVSFDGASLSLDNVAVARPTAPVEISMVVNTAGVSLFALEVRELVPNGAATALVPQLTLSAVSTTPAFVIQPEVFQPGKLYSLRVVTFAGLFTDAATGDLRTRALPVATAFVDVGIFRVTP